MDHPEYGEPTDCRGVHRCLHATDSKAGTSGTLTGTSHCNKRWYMNQSINLARGTVLAAAKSTAALKAQASDQCSAPYDVKASCYNCTDCCVGGGPFVLKDTADKCIVGQQGITCMAWDSWPALQQALRTVL